MFTTVRSVSLAVALTALVVGYTPMAFAQSADWVIVPTSTTDDISWMQPTVATVEDALSQLGIGVLPRERAVPQPRSGCCLVGGENG